MELQRSDISTIENIIHKSGIPYEGIKIELVDHLASEVERKMAADPKLHFEEALSRVGYNMKETIIHIKQAMMKKTIKDLVKNSFDFSNWMTLSLIVFYATVAFIFLMSLGVRWAPIGESYVFLSLIAFVIMKFQLRRTDTGNNYKLSVQKDYAWIPLLAVASVCFTTAIFFQLSIRTANFHWNVLQHMLTIPIALSYGFFIKAILDVTVFNVRRLKENIELDDLFEEYRPTSFELT